VITKGEVAFLAVGLIAHAAFIAEARRVPAPVYHYDEQPPTYVDIEVQPEKEEPPPPPEAPDARQEIATNDRTERTDEPHHTRGARSTTSTDHGTTESHDATNGPATSDSPSETSNQTDEYDRDDNGFAMPGAFGGPKVWQMPDGVEIGQNGPPAPTEAPKAKKVGRDKANEVIASAIKEKDKNLGLQLPAAGTVSSTLRDAVWSSDLPETGMGVFVVVIGADGKVSSVKVAQQSGGTAAQWDAAAASAKAALVSRGLKLTDEYKKGAIVTVSILSKMQNPSGTDPDSPVHFGTTTTFDISDLGAKAIRQVRITGTNVTPVK
jgi:hypothetical protein